jgi:hypothetical protein
VWFERKMIVSLIFDRSIVEVSSVMDVRRVLRNVAMDGGHRK